MKNWIFKRLIYTGLITCGASLSLQDSQAIPITGVVDFEGVVTSDSPNLTVATHFTFNSVSVGFSIGDYSSLVGSSISQSGLTFRPTIVAPVLNFWSVTQGGVTYSFDLTTFNITSLSGTHFLGLEGTGVAHATGFDDTQATWSLAATSGNSQIFTFSESTSASGIGVHGSVPDQQYTAGILGIGLALAGFLKRRALTA